MACYGKHIMDRDAVNTIVIDLKAGTQAQFNEFFLFVIQIVWDSINNL